MTAMRAMPPCRALTLPPGPASSRRRLARGRPPGRAPRAQPARRVEQPGRGDQQDDHHDEEREPVGRLRVDLGVGQLAEHAEHQSADHRPGRALDAADHQRDEPVDAEGLAQVRVGVGDRADQDAADAREQPGQRERRDGHVARVGADRRGHLRVGRDGHAELAEQRAPPVQLERRHDRDPDDDRQQLLPAHHRAEHVHRLAVQHDRVGPRGRPPDEGRPRFQDRGHAQRADQPGEAEPAERQHRPDGEQVDQAADQGRRGQPGHDAQAGRQPGLGDRRRHHDRHHEQLALGEVDHRGHVERDREPHRHEAVDGPGGQPAEQDLHVSSPAPTAGWRRRT
jgi:hypothetical protein